MLIVNAIIQNHRLTYFLFYIYKGTPVITLNASDPDLGLNGEIKYSLEPSDSSEDFKLNSQTGLLSVASELDRETKEFYDLTIKAEDHAGPINGQLPLGTIHILHMLFYSVNLI